MRRFLTLLSLLAVAAAPAFAGDGPSLPPHPPTSPPPAPPTTPGTVPAPDAATGPAKPDDKVRDAVLAAIEEVRQEVARVRGLEWKDKVPADLLTREQLIANIEKMTKEEDDPVETAKETRVLRRLGMLGEKDDPVEMMTRFLGVGVQGYYDPKKKRFFAIDGVSVEAQKPIVFHEMTHALDDQYYGLEKLTDAVKKDSDRLFALECTLEGCAEHARGLFEAAHPAIAKTLAKDETAQAVEQLKVLSKVPAFLVVPTLLHYQIGPAFVSRAVGKDFPEGMKRLFADLPVSQEQLLHPSKYLSADRDLPQKVVWSGGLAAAAGQGWKVYDDEPMGELDVEFWLDFHLGSTHGKLNLMGMAQGQMVVPEARKAAAGWDGMRMAFLEGKDAPLALVVASAWDTEKDAREAAVAMQKAIRRQYGDAYKGVDLGEAAAVGWTDSNGAGRVAVDGMRVFLVDGVPADRLDAVFGEAAKTGFERDPKDTYDPAKAADSLKGAAWRSPDGSFGWNPPSDGWKVEPVDGAKGAVRLTKGDVGFRVEHREGQIATVAMAVAKTAAEQDEEFNPLQAAKEIRVAGATAMRITWTSNEGAPPVATKHRTVLVAVADGVVVVEASAPADRWTATVSALSEALKGFAGAEED